MNAITTKYVMPSSIKPARITASDCDGNKVTIPYPHELSGEEVYLAAANALCEKMGWSGNLIGGSIEDGYVFVFSDKA